MLYGFIVVAWMILPFGDGPIMVPFASMASCEVARSIYLADGWGRHFTRRAKCVPTGATR